MSEAEVDLLEDLVKIYSPSGEEKALSDHLLERLREEDLRVEQDEVDNIVVRIGNGSPILALVSHLDTVPGELEVSREDGMLYGRGSEDAKGPLAAMISAGLRFKEKTFDGTLIVAGVVEEEIGIKGIENLLKNIEKPDYLVIGEPSGADGIAISYRGSLTLEVEALGEQVHSSSPDSSCVDDIFELHQKIREWSAEFNDIKAWKNLDFNLTNIHTDNESTNTLPASCTATYNIRLPTGVSVVDVKDRMREMGAEAGVKLRFTNPNEPYEVDKNADIVKMMKEAIRTQELSPSFKRKLSTSDMNYSGNHLGIPVISYGPGRHRTGHSANEYTEIDDYLKSIGVLEAFCEFVFGLRT